MHYVGYKMTTKEFKGLPEFKEDLLEGELIPMQGVTVHRYMCY